MDLTKYDLVITSCSWYITRGFKVGKNTKVIAYCHTPPRWLYGYETSVGFTKYWPVKIYAAIVGHFMRIYDFNTAQKINFWIANSKNVSDRIWKYYRKEAVVIYPPIETEEIKKTVKGIQKKDFYLIVSRLVGAKGIEYAVNIAQKLKINLKIVGESHGLSNIQDSLQKTNQNNIEYLGLVTDPEKYKLMAEARAFLAFARDEDFGMTVVEAQAAGTPVIAFNGGGFKESIIDGKTGILINEISEKSLREAVKKLEKTNWNSNEIMKNASNFSRERFEREMLQFINEKVRKI